MKSAIVHDWIYSISGAEKVLEAINGLYPSKIFTLIKNTSSVLDTKLPMEEVQASFLQKIPFAKEKYPYFLPLFPKAVESFDLKDFDMIISSSSCAAKGIKKRKNQLHICYCHTPMRFLWDLCSDYLRIYNLERGLKAVLTKKLFSKLRKWDIHTSMQVDHFLANSKHTAGRIKDVYNRESTVIYPPVDIDFFLNSSETKENYYVTAARFVPYKKIDLIIETFNNFDNRKLIVLGQGPQRKKLERLRRSKNIQIMGYVSDAILKKYVSKARAFIYMAHEDFGILPVEAQACGTPIIAYKKGGILETTKEGLTSILFEKQSTESLKEAILEFEDKEKTFDSHAVKAFVSQFSSDRFNREFDTFIKTAYKNHKF